MGARPSSQASADDEPRADDTFTSTVTETEQGDETPRRHGHWEGFEDFLLDDDQNPDKVQKSHGLTDGSVKAGVWKVLHHRFCESLIIFLVFTDIILLAVESSIDHHLLCVNGHIEPAGADIHIHYGIPPATRAESFRQVSLHLDDMPHAKHGPSMHQLLARDSAASGHGHSPEGGHHHGGYTNEVLTCETRDGHHAHGIVHYCHLASIGILVLFMIEIALKFWIKPGKFMHNYFLIIDATIVLVSLIIDTVVTWYVMSHLSHNNAEDIRGELTLVVAVLLFVRLWRVVRIVHGLLNYIHEHTQRTAKLQQKQQDHLDTLGQLRELCGKNKIEIPPEILDKMKPKHSARSVLSSPPPSSRTSPTPTK
jgi:hypothetical protein